MNLLTLVAAPNSQYWVQPSVVSLVRFCDRDLALCSGTYPADFGAGTKLTVLEKDREVTAPQRVEILKPSKRECRNAKDKKRKKTLVCVASGFYPDHVSVWWTINGEKVTENVATDAAAIRVVDGTYKITSRLRVYAPQWENPKNTFTCIVSFFNGTGNTEHPEEISGVKGEGKGMTRDTFMTTTQNFKLTYAVFIAKSCIYGVFVGFLVWKLQSYSGKHNY